LSELIISGRVWKFGDNINTDLLAPMWGGKRKEYCLAAIRPEFPKTVKQGDVVVAGRNFGCGSSRESAPSNLKDLGVGVVVAETFGRIFFRNSIAIGLPVLAVEGVSKGFKDGDTLQLNLRTAEVKNLRTGKTWKGTPLSPQMIEIIEAGGALELLKKKK